MGFVSVASASLTVGDRIGLAFVVESAFLSVFTSLFLLCWILYNSFSKRNTDWHFFRSGVDYYIAALFFSDIILALGSVLHIRWINNGVVKLGTYCTAQGALKQLGDVGVALFTGAIAIHSMAVIFFKFDQPPSKKASLSFVVGVWIFLLMITAIPSSVHKDPPYYGVNAPWCFINPYYGYGYLIGLEYGILWFVLLAGLVSWAVSYFCLRGNIVVEYPSLAPTGRWNVPSVSWRSFKPVEQGNGVSEKSRGPGMFGLPVGYEVQPIPQPPSLSRTRESGSGDDEPRRQTTSQQALGEAAWERLLFPIAYVIVIAPQSVVRLVKWTHPHWHNSAVVNFAQTLWSASGFINVILYVYTRPSLVQGLTFRRSRLATHPEDDHPASGGARRARPGVTMPEVTIKDTSSSLNEEPTDSYGSGPEFAPGPGYRYGAATRPKSGTSEGFGSSKYSDHDRQRFGYEMQNRSPTVSGSAPTASESMPSRVRSDEHYVRW